MRVTHMRITAAVRRPGKAPATGLASLCARCGNFMCQRHRTLIDDADGVRPGANCPTYLLDKGSAGAAEEFKWQRKHWLTPCSDDCHKLRGAAHASDNATVAGALLPCMRPSRCCHACKQHLLLALHVQQTRAVLCRAISLSGAFLLLCLFRSTWNRSVWGMSARCMQPLVGMSARCMQPLVGMSAKCLQSGLRIRSKSCQRGRL
jgi:hypothetical protein